MFPQLQAVDEAAVENQDQMPADPQEPLEETVESCLLQVMQCGWRTWDMSVCCACEEIWIAASDCSFVFQNLFEWCGSSFIEVQDRCMDLDKGLAHLWFARFCKLYFFDVREGFACSLELCRTPCQKAQCIQSYGLWMCPDKNYRYVLVLSLTFVL